MLRELRRKIAEKRMRPLVWSIRGMRGIQRVIEIASSEGTHLTGEKSDEG
jgi:hypothetical protein